MRLHRFFFRAQHNALLRLGIELDKSLAHVAAIDREANIKQKTITYLGKEASALKARVAELEGEKLALYECWSCKVTLEKVGTPESRVPRCSDCPEPDSLEEVGKEWPEECREGGCGICQFCLDQSVEGGSDGETPDRE